MDTIYTFGQWKVVMLPSRLLNKSFSGLGQFLTIRSSGCVSSYSIFNQKSSPHRLTKLLGLAKKFSL